MSNLNKRILATAVAVAIASPAAFAATVSVTGANVHALELTGAAAPTAETTAAIQYRLEAGDILVGRQEASGNVNIRVNLSGASFAQAPTITLGSAYDINSDTAVCATNEACIIGSPVLSGGVLSFVIRPPADAPGFIAYSTSTAGSELFNIASGTSLTSATAIKTAGSPGVTMTIDARDVTSGNTLQAPGAATSILTSQQATSTAWTSGGSFTADVTQAKAKFTNSPTNAGFQNDTLITLGSLAVTIPTNRSAGGSGITDNDSNGTTAGGNFQYDTNTGGASATRDRVNFTVTFADAAAFGNSGVFISSAADCSVNVATLTRASNVYTGNANLPNATGGTLYVCGQVDGTTAIEQQTITASAQVDLLNTNTVDPSAATTSSLATIAYNGSSANVFFMNPGPNTTQESTIRIVNRASTAGVVRITARCDNGVQGSGVSFNLLGNNAVNLTAAELESGSSKTNNTFLTYSGTCTGKRRINVTGEFSPMSVQSFIRNVNSAGTTTTNVNLDN